MSIEVSLTGRQRYRLSLFRKRLILQVEEHTKGYEDDAYGGGRNIDIKRWRDAKIEDLTVRRLK